MKILVSGGAGYIGTHTCVALLEAGYDVVVADNLINASREALRRVEEITGKTVPFVKADLCDRRATRPSLMPTLTLRPSFTLPPSRRWGRACASRWSITPIT